MADTRRLLRGRLRPSASAALAGVALMAACSHSDVQYIGNRDAGLFVKLPASWTTFTTRDGDVNPSAGQVPGAWRLVFDAAENPARSHLEDDEPLAPVGYIEVTPTALLRNIELGSHLALRSIVFEVDPLEVAELDDAFEVLTYEEVELENGYWGNRLTMRFTLNDDVQHTFTQLVFLDRGQERVNVMRIFCTSSCYEQHQAEIEAVLDSWTLRNP